MDLARILIVEDNEDLLRMMQELLAIRHDVETTGEGESALALVEQTAFDLVLLDIQLPGIDGVETGRRIKMRRPEVPILVLTARAQADDAEEILRSGCCDAYLAKPATVNQIRDAVEELLAAGSGTG